MCVHIFKRYLRQTWNYIIRSFILLTLGILTFSSQARISAANVRSIEPSDTADLQIDKNRSWL